MRAELLEKITGNNNPLQVNLAGMQITDDEILEIMKTIKGIKPAASLIDLDDNHIGDKGAIILSEQLHGFNTIKEISLQYNEVGREGAMKLFGLKKVFSDLEILFHGNQIMDVGEMYEIERLALAK